MSDLHHPIGAALGKRRHEHILFAGNITPKRILLLEGFPLAGANAAKYAFGASGLLKNPDERSGNRVDPCRHDPAKNQRRRLALELANRRADFGSSTHRDSIQLTELTPSPREPSG